MTRVRLRFGNSRVQSELLSSIPKDEVKMRSHLESHPNGRFPRPLERPSMVYIVGGHRAERAKLLYMVYGLSLAVRTFDSGADLLESLGERRPSVALIMASQSEIDAFELQRYLATHHPEIPLIFVTCDGDIPMSVRAMKAGAFDFLSKPVSTESLHHAVREALEQSRNVLAHQHELDALRRSYDSLSPREREVMASVVSGQLNKQVASALGITEITVKVHRGQVMRKMNASSFAALVKQADRLGITEGPTLEHSVRVKRGRRPLELQEEVLWT
jgi:FixJ family two-component response regulator